MFRQNQSIAKSMRLAPRAEVVSVHSLGFCAPWFWLLLALAWLCAAMPGRVWAQDAAPLNHETAYLARLINEARTAPLAMLQRAGIDEAAARAALGDDAWILDTGLPPLAPNDQLTASAQAHLEDMVSRLYYATVSPEGLGPTDRAEAVGYLLVNVEELLGLLGVVTFVDGPEAVWTVFRQWLIADITAANPESRRLFASWPTDMGVSFQAVTVVLDGVSINAYVAVCDVGLPQFFHSMVVGSVRGPGSSEVFLDPWNPPPGALSVRCRSEDGTLWSETLTDSLGGYVCPALPEWQPVILDVVDQTTGAVLASGRTAAGGTHVWLDLFLPQ